jgi:hypothetical protein
VPVDVDPAEAEAIADHVRGAFDRYSDAVAQGDVAAIATPSAEACRFCPFSTHCDAFWQAAVDSWADAGVASASGEVIAITSSNGFATLSLESRAGTLHGHVAVRALNLEDFPGLLELGPGDLVAVTGIHVRGEASECWASFRTRVGMPGPAHL